MFHERDVGFRKPDGTFEEKRVRWVTCAFYDVVDTPDEMSLSVEVVKTLGVRLCDGYEADVVQFSFSDKVHVCKRFTPKAEHSELNAKVIAQIGLWQKVRDHDSAAEMVKDPPHQTHQTSQSQPKYKDQQTTDRKDQSESISIWLFLRYAGSTLSDLCRRFHRPKTRMLSAEAVESLIVSVAEALAKVRQTLTTAPLETRPESIFVSVPTDIKEDDMEHALLSATVRIADFVAVQPTIWDSNLIDNPYISPAEIRARTGGGSVHSRDRACVYSFGGIMFLMCTGHAPWDEERFGAYMLVKRVSQGACPLDRVDLPDILLPNLPPPLFKLMQDCFSADAKTQPTTIIEVRDRLKTVKGSTVDGFSMDQAVQMHVQRAQEFAKQPPNSNATSCMSCAVLWSR